MSGLSHPYASLNGSPNSAFSNRYSPSTYNSSMKTSPTLSSHSHGLSSSAYSVSNLLPQTYDANNTNSNDNISHYSPNAKHRSRDWSPAKNSTNSIATTTTSAQNISSSISATTIPKKTASIRQKYGSLSPNGVNESSTSSKSDRKSIPTTNDNAHESKVSTKRSRSPVDVHKKYQQHESSYEKEFQAQAHAHAQYQNELAMHRNLMALQQQQQQQQVPTSNPFLYNIYGGNTPHSAYLNPLYHSAYLNPASIEMFQRIRTSIDPMSKNILPSWIDPYNPTGLMHYPPNSVGLISDKKANEMNAMLSPYQSGLSSGPSIRDTIEHKKVAIPSSSTSSTSWNDAYKTSASPSAFRRQPQQQKYNECEPISLIKDESISHIKDEQSSGENEQL